MYESIFGQFCVLLSSSLWNISPEKFFQAFKKSSGHSRDILAFPCELWRWAALLVDRPLDFFAKQSSVAKCMNASDAGVLTFPRRFYNVKGYSFLLRLNNL